jgi:hypothetical protein
VSVDVVIVSGRQEGESLARAISGAGLTLRRQDPGQPPPANLDPPPLAVLIDARVVGSLGAVELAEQWRREGYRCVVIDRDLGAEALRELKDAAAARGSTASGSGPAPPGDHELGLDISRRIDDAVGEAMADLVGAVVGEVVPTLPSDTTGVLEELQAAERVDAQVRAARDRLLALHALVAEGDYFQILGVGREASRDDIEKAFNLLRAEMSAPALPEPVRLELGHHLSEIGAVLAEARAILSNESLRAAYRKNLRD